MRTLSLIAVILNFVCLHAALSAQLLPRQILRQLPGQRSSVAVPAGATFPDDLKFYVYTRRNADKPQEVEPSVESVIRNIYQPLLPTTVSIPRLGAAYNASEHNAIVAATLEQENCNVIVVDWSSSNKVDAGQVSANGAIIADFLLLLHKHFDVGLERIYLVGFAEGAHVAGAVGRNIYAQAAVKLRHITGLDPAPGVLELLSSYDAEFVEVIHTNMGGLGLKTPCGHADYYPNGGAVQPNCAVADQQCSHERAYELVKEMWSQQNEFISARCASTELMGVDECVWLNIKMGQNLQKHGVYYLETNAQYPYSKGSFVFKFL